MLRYLRDGFDELRESQPIVGVLLISTLHEHAGVPVPAVLPVFARDVLHVDAVGLGVLGAAAGVGSLVGALAHRRRAAACRVGAAVLDGLAA